MMEVMTNKYIIYVVMGIFAIVGVVSKLIVSVSFRNLMKAAGNMGKSNHALMRLVRSKFEHVCMISEKLENVEAFVDKFLFEYQVGGIRLHTIRRMEMTSAAMCLLLGFVGGALSMKEHGISNEPFLVMAVGAVLALLVTIVHFSTDEAYRLEIVRNYMVDYLENICMGKFGKAKKREKAVVPERVKTEEKQEKQNLVLDENVEVKAETKPDIKPEMKQQVEMTLREASEHEVKPEVKPEVKQQEKPENEQKEEPREVRIRQILEEFMA